MNSKRKLTDNEEKQQEPEILNRLPKALKHHTLSFLAGHSIQSRTINSLYFSPFLKESLFSKDKLLISAAHRVAHNLAYRIDEKETLAFIQRNTNILQSLPIPIQIMDPYGRPIKRRSIMEVLVALDEFSIVAATPEAKSYDLISTVFSWFDQVKNPKSCHVKKQLQRQLEETSNVDHTEASKKRRDHYLQEIEIFIKKVIQCAEISNDSYEVPFEKLLELPFVQDFIKNAFHPIRNDNGEWGVVWDCWQLNLDYVSLLKTYTNNDSVPDKSRPNLGGLWSRKTDVADVGVYMAFLRSSQFCHLEVYSRGIGNVSAEQPPGRFDCTRGRPDILDGIGDTAGFGFYGHKYGALGAGHGRWGEAAALGLYKTFVKQKQQLYTTYSASDRRQEPLSDNVEIRRSPSATAAGR